MYQHPNSHLYWIFNVWTTDGYCVILPWSTQKQDDLHFVHQQQQQAEQQLIHPSATTAIPPFPNSNNRIKQHHVQCVARPPTAHWCPTNQTNSISQISALWRRNKARNISVLKGYYFMMQEISPNPNMAVIPIQCLNCSNKNLNGIYLLFSTL